MSETQRSPELEAIPQGWSFNPSTRAHRLRLLPLAGTGFAISCYLTLCQLRIIPHAWDPFFPDGTERVLHSSVSQALPIPDALLGAFVYLLEIVLLTLGPDDRWRTRPWLTRFSGITLLGLGGASLGLLILQPTVVNDWCTWCLLSALLAFVLVQRSLPEFLACIQSRFFILDEPDTDARIHPTAQMHLPWTKGTRCVWTLFVSAILGAFLLALPPLAGIEGIAKITVEFSGAVVVAVSVVSMSEPARALRFINGFIGMILVCWFLGQPLGLTRWIAGALGLALTALSIYSPKTEARYGIFSFDSTLVD